MGAYAGVAVQDAAASGELPEYRGADLVNAENVGLVPCEESVVAPAMVPGSESGVADVMVQDAESGESHDGSRDVLALNGANGALHV